MQIKEYFCELIGSTIEASVRSVRAFVREYLVSHSWRLRLSRSFLSWCVSAACMSPSTFPCSNLQHPCRLQAATIDEARATITTYAERFTSSMLNALAVSEQGVCRARTATHWIMVLLHISAAAYTHLSQR